MRKRNEIDPYVEQVEGVYRLVGTRISLDSIVYAFRDGETPEVITHSFPSLTLEQVYGAVAFYLANRPEIDAYLATEEKAYEDFRAASRDQDPAFFEKIAAARRELLAS
ncbi:MAG: DUF433 domain-containing protein [Acidobacteriota bacterium]